MYFFILFRDLGESVIRLLRGDGLRHDKSICQPPPLESAAETRMFGVWKAVWSTNALLATCDSLK